MALSKALPAAVEVLSVRKQTMLLMAAQAAAQLATMRQERELVAKVIMVAPGQCMTGGLEAAVEANLLLVKPGFLIKTMGMAGTAETV